MIPIDEHASDLLKELHAHWMSAPFQFTSADLSPEEKLSIDIYRQRYRNLQEYCARFVDAEDRNFLCDYWFFVNGLHEFTFLGPDFCRDICLTPETLPYLYRIGSRDTDITQDKQDNQKEFDALKTACEQGESPIACIISQVDDQISKNVSQTTTYSYSKCLGVDLFKYATVQTPSICTPKVCVEVRKNAPVNQILFPGKDPEQLNLYAYDLACRKASDSYKNFPYYSVDVSQYRKPGDSKEKKKLAIVHWLESFTHKKHNFYNEIFDPELDREVVRNFQSVEICFPGETVERFTFHMDELLILLLKYAVKLAEKTPAGKELPQRFRGAFNRRCCKLTEKEKTYLKEHCTQLKELFDKNDRDATLLESVDWNNECKWMQPYLSYLPQKDITDLFYKADHSSNLLIQWKHALLDSLPASSI